MGSDGKTITVTFFNGDVKQMMPDGTVVGILRFWHLPTKPCAYMGAHTRNFTLINMKSVFCRFIIMLTLRLHILHTLMG